MTERPRILTIREETLRMAGLSIFGEEIALARWRNSNPDLFQYVERMHPLLPDLVAPFYNLILLEYEVQNRKIPLVTPSTIRDYVPPEDPNDFDLEDFKREQQQLARQVSNYLNTLSVSEPELAAAAEFAIHDTYTLIKTQAAKEPTSLS